MGRQACRWSTPITILPQWLARTAATDDGQQCLLVGCVTRRAHPSDIGVIRDCSFASGRRPIRRRRRRITERWRPTQFIPGRDREERKFVERFPPRRRRRPSTNPISGSKILPIEGVIEKYFFARSPGVGSSDRVPPVAFARSGIHVCVHCVNCGMPDHRRIEKTAEPLCSLLSRLFGLDYCSNGWTSIRLAVLPMSNRKRVFPMVRRGRKKEQAVVWELLVSPQKFVDTRKGQ